MKKVSWLKILFVAIQIARDVVAALNDAASPGHITEEEFKVIIANAIEAILGKTA